LHELRLYGMMLAEALEIDLGTPDQASQAPLLEIEVIAGTQPANPFVAAYGAVAMQVLANRELHTKDGPSPSERSTRHVALALPAARIRLHKSDGRKTSLPVDEPILLVDLLANYVELQDVASRSQLRAMLPRVFAGTRRPSSAG
jgi:cytochrome P450/NADPH-cytochrome P450 reductase